MWDAVPQIDMEQFLLELGRGFAFVGRQYAMQIGSRRFKVDLVFYHCVLKCYVLTDLSNLLSELKAIYAIGASLRIDIILQQLEHPKLVQEDQHDADGSEIADDEAEYRVQRLT